MAKPERDADPDDEVVSPREALIAAAVVVMVVSHLVPFGDTILYPFTLMATWVHEMGHGLTALLVGGSFESLDVFANGSGLAHVSAPAPWQHAAYAAGGLVAPPIVGALILALGRGPARARIALGALALVMAISLPVWVRSVAGWIALPLLVLVIGYFAVKAGPIVRTIAAQFVGLLLALDTLTGIDYLFTGSATVDGVERPSDVALIADALGGHFLFYGIPLALLSLALLVLGVRLAWAKPLFRRAATRAATPRR